MSPLKKAVHWNHTPCEDCKQKNGLTDPPKSRPQAGPCCFCGGPRPDAMRGRGDASCNGMTAETLPPVTLPTFKEPAMTELEVAEDVKVLDVPHPEKDINVFVELRVDDPPKQRAERRFKKTVAQKRAEQRRSGPVTDYVKIKQAEKKPAQKKAAAPVRKETGHERPVPSPELAAQWEKEKKYAAALVAFGREAIMGKMERGSNEQFSFVTVKLKDTVKYGHGGAHIHRGHGNWVGRSANRSHIAKRGLLITDRKTHQPVALVVRWRCGQFSSFSNLTTKPVHKLCATCVDRDEYAAAQAEREAKKEKTA